MKINDKYCVLRNGMIFEKEITKIDENSEEGKVWGRTVAIFVPADGFDFRPARGHHMDPLPDLMDSIHFEICHSRLAALGLLKTSFSKKLKDLENASKVTQKIAAETSRLFMLTEKRIEDYIEKG